MLNTEYDIVNKVSKELSSFNENLYSSILSLKNEIQVLNQKNNELQNQLLDIKFLNMENKNTQLLFKENLDMEKVKKICTELKIKVDRIADVFSKENDLYKYKIMNDFEEVKKLSKEFNNVCFQNFVRNEAFIEEFDKDKIKE